jgi:fluoroquinolone resistance protein
VVGPPSNETFLDEDWYGEELVERAYTGCTFGQLDLTEAFGRAA